MFFHHHTIRKYTTALLDVFSDLEVPRYDQEGNLIKAINVPIVFSSRERAVQLIEKAYTDNNGEQNILPRLALSMDSMEKATDRDTNRSKKINIQGDPDDTGKLTYQYNSVAYDFNYTLHIMARTMTDLTVIIEQILPQFRPTMNIRIQELDFLDKMISIPISNEGVSFDFPIDEDEDADIRILTADISLRMRGDIHLPVKDGSVIKYIEATLYDPDVGNISRTIVEGTPFDDDSITYTKEDEDYE